MSAFEAAATAIGEIVSYVVGRVIGKTFRVEPKRAQELGVYVVLGVILGAMLVVTFVYS